MTMYYVQSASVITDNIRNGVTRLTHDIHVSKIYSERLLYIRLIKITSTVRFLVFFNVFRVINLCWMFYFRRLTWTAAVMTEISATGPRLRWPKVKTFNIGLVKIARIYIFN